MNRKIIIDSSDLFDPKFYRLAYPDMLHYRGNLYTHYVGVGVGENRLPNLRTFKKIYPLFHLKIYKSLSRDLRFKNKEQYCSHLHHIGFDANRYFGFKNKMFINKSRMGHGSHLTGFNKNECPPGLSQKGDKHMNRHHHHRNRKHRSHKHVHSQRPTRPTRSNSPRPDLSSKSQQPVNSPHDVVKNLADVFIVDTNKRANEALAIINHLKKQTSNSVIDNVLKQLAELVNAPQQGIIINQIDVPINPCPHAIPVSITPSPKPIPISLIPPVPHAPVTPAISDNDKKNELNLLPYSYSLNGSSTRRELVQCNGSVSLQELSISVNDGFKFTAEMPNNWKNNSVIVPHLHWTPCVEMYGMNENIILSWIIKPVGSDNSHSQNSFSETIKIGSASVSVIAKSVFAPCVTSGLSGHNHIIIGQLARITEGASYTDDILISGLDLVLLFE